MVEWFNAACAIDLSTCPKESVRDPNEKLMIELNDLRTPEPDYYFALLEKFNDPSVSNMLLTAFIGFLGNFMDDGQPKDFHTAGYNCGRILFHIVEPDLGAADCPGL